MKIRTLAFAAVTIAALTFAMPATMTAQVQRSEVQQAVPPDTSKPAVGPAIQRIATASAVSTEPLGAVMGVRELPDGRVLVNDGQRRRLVLMDTTLKVTQVVLDSLTDVANAYGTRAGMLIPFRGDTTLFIDPASYAILMLDRNGRIARVRSVWRVQDLGWLMQTQLGVPGVDAKGRIVYRIGAQAAPPKIAPPAGVPYFPVDPDSAFIVAVNLDTRKIDTLGSIRIPKSETRIRQTADNGFMFDNIINPLPRTDDWAVLPDGRVAFVRGQDYRIEYLQPDATWKSSAKLPYEWQRLLDDDKKKLVDSVRTLQTRNVETQYVTSVIRWVNMYNGKFPEGLKIPSGYVPGPGFPKDWLLPPGVRFPENYIYACAPGQEPPAGMSVQSMSGPPAGMTIPTSGGTVITSAGGGAVRENVRMGGAATIDMSGGAPGGGRPASVACLPAPVQFSTGGFVPPPPTMRPVLVTPADELPDYKPPFNTGAVRSDEDGNLWIRTVPPKPIPGGGVYDIVNAEGELVTRYQMPPGYTIVGFGKGKVVYATMRDATGIHLARIRLK